MLFDSQGRQIVVGTLAPAGGAPVNIDTKIRNAAILTATLVPSTILSVAGARKIHLKFLLNAAAILNELVLVPMVNSSAVLPQTTDDTWHPYLESNESAFDADIDAGVTLPVGGPPFTKAPNWRMVILEPLMFRFKAATGAANKIRGRATLDVEGENWFQILVADAGAGAPLGNLEIHATVTA